MIIFIVLYILSSLQIHNTIIYTNNSRRSPLNTVVTVNLTIACISMAAVLYNSWAMKYIIYNTRDITYLRPGKNGETQNTSLYISKYFVFGVPHFRKNRRQCTSLCELGGLDIAKGGLPIALGKWNIF